MKKVLFLIHTLGGGGAEKVLINLVNHMDKTMYDITVMTIVDVGELRYHLNEDITYKTTIPLRRKQKVRKKSDKSGSLLNDAGTLKLFMAKLYAKLWKYMPVKLFYKLFIREKYDVEISFLEGICAKVISASSNPFSKKYAWIHVDLMKQTKSSGVFRGIRDEVNVYSKFDNIVCVSEVVKEQFIHKYSFDPKKVIVKYNSIDKEDILRKSQEGCRDFEKDDDSLLLCSVGRLNKQKSYDRLLHVFHRLTKEFPKLQLIIIGEGTARHQLDDYIMKHHLSDKVTLLGFKSNPYPYMVQSDLLVCSSVAEGFSTVVCESIILGVPVVTTDCSGMKEMLGSHNEYGIVTENHEDALYEGIKTMIENPNIYMKYQKMVSRRSILFDVHEATRQVEELLGDSYEC